MGDLLTHLAYQDSPIHRLDPRVKALWIFVGLFYIFSTADWRLLMLVMAVNLVLLMLARISLRVLLPLLISLIFFGLVILVFQLLFQTGEVWATLGPIRLHTRGFAVTREAWLRLSNMALLFAQYMMWTHPTDIALMLVRLGVPYRMALMIGFALRSFPLLQREAVRIMEVQQVRGRPLDGTWQKIAGLVTIMLPLTLRVLRRTTEISIAMELRGFGYARERTYLRSIGMRLADWLVVIVLGLAAGLRVALLLGWI